MTTPLIGVVGVFNLSSGRSKQALMLFDEIITASHSIPAGPGPYGGPASTEKMLEWVRLSATLHVSGALVPARHLGFRDGAMAFPQGYYADPYPEAAFPEMDRYTRHVAGSISNRITPPVPLLFTSLDQSATPETSQGTVVRIVLHSLPLPDTTTPLQAILDWRGDDDAKVKYRRLRAWMNKISRQSLPMSHVEDELATLLDDYTSYMRIQHTKLGRSRVEVIVTIVAEVLEDVARFRFSSAASRLFVLAVL